ncbi:MAG: SpoIIE family protein phosphatase [Acidobacteria bacterium]|nr:SpoIIE family protein phosphatase [Acidobacteriota bacterium]
MTEPERAVLADELRARRERLAPLAPGREDLAALLVQVDAALDRLDRGTWGICVVCHEPIERELLDTSPLVQACLGDLSAAEQRELERDLTLAREIQQDLLPRQPLARGGWEVRYHLEPAGLVGGDCCDLQPWGDGVFFLVADVSGKGVAASMLMSHLLAIFRSLVPADLPLATMVERANRVFSASTSLGRYATLVCGRAAAGGEVEYCNAGHLPPLLLRGEEAIAGEPDNLPVGLFPGGAFRTTRTRLGPGESLVLYTDGITEAAGAGGEEYGRRRLAGLLARAAGRAPQELIGEWERDMRSYLDGRRPADDRTLMVVRRCR